MISFDAVEKEYRRALRRPVRALAGVDLDVMPGAAVGVIGLNGAGKSTLLRMLLGYLRPTKGSVRIGGLEPRTYVRRNGIAYVPERVAVPPRWTVRGALEAYALLGDSGEGLRDRVEAALQRLGLGELADRRAGALSKGNLQRLAIAQAILEPRQIMVLDEPTDALDPVWTAELRTIVREWRAADPERILMLASHNLHETELLVEDAVVLHEGAVRCRLRIDESETTLEERFLTLIRGWSAEAA